MGTNAFNLTSANSLTNVGALDIETSDTLSDTSGLYPLGIGRQQWPFSEDGGGAGYNTDTGTWSDVALFYQTLTPQQIARLYAAGIGGQIQVTPNGPGSQVLNWIQGGILQSATNAAGPYTDVAGSPVPPYTNSVPATGKMFYRVRW